MYLHPDSRPGDRATPSVTGWATIAPPCPVTHDTWLVRSAPSVPPRHGRGPDSRVLLTWASQRPSCPSTSEGTSPSGRLIAGSPDLTDHPPITVRAHHVRPWPSARRRDTPYPTPATTPCTPLLAKRTRSSARHAPPSTDVEPPRAAPRAVPRRDRPLPPKREELHRLRENTFGLPQLFHFISRGHGRVFFAKTFWPITWTTCNSAESSMQLRGSSEMYGDISRN